MNNKEPGYVYILTRSTSGRLHTCKNPSFREDWVKIEIQNCTNMVQNQKTNGCCYPNIVA